MRPITPLTLLAAGVGADQTVNGVTFTAAETGTAITGATGESITLNSGGNNQGAFGTGGFADDGPDANLGQLIAGGSFNIGTVTLGGLTVGNDYLIQTFTHDGRGSRDDAQSAYSNGISPDVDLASVTELNSLVGDPVVRIGSFTIGTFTADAVTQTFTVFGDGNGRLMMMVPLGLRQPIVRLLSMRFNCVT